MAVPYAQALAQAEALKAAGQLPPNETIATIAQKIMRGGSEGPALPERGGMPAMTTGLLEGVRAAADPIAAETAARQARAAQAGGVSPEMEAIYAAREARLAAQDEVAPKDDRRAAWDALAQMGFKMAQTTSPYFATALAEGMQAGSQGYNAAKVAAAEKAARRAEEKENVSLARLKDRQAAIAAAEEGYGSDVEMAGKKAALSDKGAEAALNQIKLKYADTLAKLGVEAAEADLRNDVARLQLTKAQTANVIEDTRLAGARIAASGGGEGGGSTRGVSPTAVFEAQQSALKQMEEKAIPVNEARAEYKAAIESGDTVGAAQAKERARIARLAYDGALARYRQISGGAAPVTPRASVAPASVVKAKPKFLGFEQ